MALGAGDPTAQHARVLVVDDEADIREVLTRFLGLLGHYARGAESGAQALSDLREVDYDVAIVDIRMPGMDGIEFARIARQAHPHLELIFLTGHASLDSAIAAVRTHAADYLRKPVGVEEVAEAIADALQQRSSRGEEREPIAAGILNVGQITLDQSRRIVTVTTGDPTEARRASLTACETYLLAYLMERPELVIGPRELARSALGYQVGEGEAVAIVRPHISRLRKKVEVDPQRPKLLCTLHGRGYYLSPEGPGGRDG